MAELVVEMKGVVGPHLRDVAVDFHFGIVDPLVPHVARRRRGERGAEPRRWRQGDRRRSAAIAHTDETRARIELLAQQHGVPGAHGGEHVVHDREYGRAIAVLSLKTRRREQRRGREKKEGAHCLSIVSRSRKSKSWRGYVRRMSCASPTATYPSRW